MEPETEEDAADVTFTAQGYLNRRSEGATLVAYQGSEEEEEGG